MSGPWFPAKVFDASDRRYVDAVLSLIDRAKKEIILSFYLIDPADTAPPSHPVNRLIDALVRARARDVTVRIFMNTNFRFHPKTAVGTGNHFDKLFRSGAIITALIPGRRLHDKLIVIDRHLIVEGSMNWTSTALLSNFESATIIDSPKLAAKKLERLRRLTLPLPPKKLIDEERALDRAFLQVPEEVELPATLFERNGLPRMIRASDERSMDLYLILLGQAAAVDVKEKVPRPPRHKEGGSVLWRRREGQSRQGGTTLPPPFAKKTDESVLHSGGQGGRNLSSEIVLDLESAGRALKFPEGWDRSAIRRQMIKVLKKLEKDYGVIEAEFPYAHNVHIRLKKLQGETVSIPGWMLEARYIAEQSSGMIFMGLAGEILKKEGVDIRTLSAPELEKRFHIGKTTFIRARKSGTILTGKPVGKAGPLPVS